MAVDLAGLFSGLIANVLLVGVQAVLVLMYRRVSWFTVERWQPIANRGPRSISGLLLCVVAVGLVGWGAAWQRSDWDSWRLQNALAAACLALTVFHVVGCVSLMV
jgi:hypothetical protein